MINDDLSTKVDFLIKHKLNTNQLLLLEVLSTENFVKKDDKLRLKTAGNIYKWSAAAKHIKGAGWSEQEIEDLIKKDYIFGIKSEQIDNEGNKVYTYAVDQLILTQKFSDIMFINSNFAFEEILELYPDTFLINNQTVFTKAGDLDKVQQNYFKLIKGNLLKHEEIKQIISYAKERSLCNYKIENFLSKGVIETIKKMMEENYETGRDI